MGQRVLIVDDQASFRHLARALLEADGFEVIGEAADGAAAVHAVNALAPDVVLLDVRLPDRSGIDVARDLRATSSPPAVVLTSTADYARAADDCGAAGFIPKGRLSGPALRAHLGPP
jgi:DNA-binding NarL/FixJ family response regulator